MSYPTDAQLTAWAQTLNTTDWTKLASRLANAIDRDRRGGSAIPDGYPGGGGSAGGHSGFVVDGEFVPATSVELVALGRGQARDEHHDRTTNAVGYLEQAIQSLGALVTQLDRIEARVVVVGHSDDDWCVVHRRHGMTEAVYRGHYCRWCYDFRLVERVDPPADLLLARADGKRITDAMVRQAMNGRSA